MKLDKGLTSCIIVEDDDEQRKVIQDALQTADYCPIPCGTREEALTSLGRLKMPVAIVLDLRLQSEFEQAFRIIVEARGIMPSVQIIILTAHGSISHAVRALKLGAADFIEKPHSHPYTSEDIARVLLPKLKEVLSNNREKRLIGRQSALKNYSEDILIDSIVIPLLKEMGYLGVGRVNSHGSGELGRDILPFYKYGDFGERIYYAAQVKVGNITAKSGMTKNVHTVIDQLKSALSVPFTDPIEGIKRKIDRCLFICSGKITNDARRLIEEAMENTKGISLIDVHCLIGLLEQNEMLDYFDRLSLKNQR